MGPVVNVKSHAQLKELLRSSEVVVVDCESELPGEWC
jgi:hypothetical protein